MTPYQQGYNSGLRSLGLCKTAGYFQNIVGFDDPAMLEKLREAGGDRYYKDMAAFRKAMDDERGYYDALRSAKSKAVGPEPQLPPREKGFISTLRRMFLGRPGREEQKAWQGKSDKWLEDYYKEHPRIEIPDPTGRAELLGGQELGTLGKYVEIPEIYPFGETSPYIGGATGEGYLAKEDILKRLADVDYGTHLTPDIAERVKQSPFKYYTSTEAG